MGKKVPEDEIDEKKLLRHHMKFHRHRQKVNARPESEQYTYIEIIPDKKCKCVEQKWKRMYEIAIKTYIRYIIEDIFLLPGEHVRVGEFPMILKKN